MSAAVRVRVTEPTSGNSFVETRRTRKDAEDYARFVNETSAHTGVRLIAEVVK